MITTQDITKATNLLREGRLVAFPTETVYGLGADATNEAAIRKIFQAKERPFDHPLIVHIAHQDQMKDWAKEVSHEAMVLANAFWPGPLTLILKKKPGVLDVVTGGQETIGLRIPRHPIAQSLLQAFGGGVAAPSANKFTHISPTTAQAVKEELGGSVDLILDGGACEVGLESTIIDMSGKTPVILRPGMISTEEIMAKLGMKVSLQRKDAPTERAPGMHHLHYAPTTKTILMATSDISHFLQTIKPKELPIALVVLSDFELPPQIHCVKMPSTATNYAHDLYQVLREMDSQHFKQIVIERVPESAEWEAIRDRLMKASCRN